MVKRIIIYITLVMALICSAGCGPQRSEVNTAGRAVTDATNTSVTVPERPERIIPIGVSTEDIVLSLVPTDRIMALGNLPNNQPDLSSKVVDRVKMDAESIMPLHPDLVVAPDWVNADAITELRNMGIPVYVYKTPTTIAESQEAIRVLAEVVGNPDGGRQLTDGMNRDIAEARQLVSRGHDPQSAEKSGTRPVVAYYSSMGLIGGKGSTFDDLCRYLEVDNAAAAAGLGAIDTGTREQLIAMNPDVIIVPSDTYNQDQYKELTVNGIYSDPALQSVRAVADRRIYVADAPWIMAYSQFMTKALVQLAQDIYGPQSR